VASTDSRIRVYEQISGCKKVCFEIEKEETFASGHMVARAKLNNVRWGAHCRDLVQLPVAA
jgi:hypothetical protein